MKVVIQRVNQCSVSIASKQYSEIGQGMLVLCGFEDADTNDDIVWTANKIANLRIFDDSEGVMNLSVKDINADIMIVSQFTLHASTKKGNRPSYIKSAKPEISIPLYKMFFKEINKATSKLPKTGVFGAEMKVSLINDGPVTILIDSKNKE
jgi:D-tyrosyl-tRNA(Tyr) deacylase